MCEYCRCIGNNHAAGCPLNEEPKIIDRCFICGEAIHEGDTMYRLTDDDAIHADCLQRLTPEEVFDVMCADPSVSFANQTIDAEMFCKAFDVWAEEA